MKTGWIAAALAAMSLNAAAVQETFTDDGPLDCSLVKVCSQTTSDGLFLLKFKPAYPWSAPLPLDRRIAA